MMTFAEGFGDPRTITSDAANTIQNFGDDPISNNATSSDTPLQLVFDIVSIAASSMFCCAVCKPLYFRAKD